MIVKASTHSSILRCKCRKSGLNFSEICQCHDCQNDKKDEFVKPTDHAIDENNEY